MELYLLRHAIAAPPRGDDGERPLTPEGEAQAERAGRAFRRLDVRPDRVLCSPALRCRWTAEKVLEGLATPQPRLEIEPSLHEDSPAPLLRRLAGLGDLDALLLVGHQPQLETLLSVVLSGTAGVRVHLGRCGSARVDVEGMPPSRPGTLVWVLQARHLRAVADAGRTSGGA